MSLHFGYVYINININGRYFDFYFEQNDKFLYR